LPGECRQLGKATQSDGNGAHENFFNNRSRNKKHVINLLSKFLSSSTYLGLVVMAN